MTEILRSWVINIVLIMFFLILLENLLPNSELKKYVKIISGLVLIIVIIRPVVVSMRSDVFLADKCFKHLNEYSKYSITDDANFIKAQKDQIKATYTEMIRKSIEKYIVKNSEYSPECIKVGIITDENSESNYKVEKLDIVLNKGVKKDANTDISIKQVSIKKISVSDQKSENKRFENEELTGKLSESYGVSADNIRLYLVK